QRSVGRRGVRKLLRVADLVPSARAFCAERHGYPELFGVTDGKAVGTFIEIKFEAGLAALYTVQAGNAALGIDLPALGTRLQAPSMRQPQSSCPFRSARQKVYGLGYHLLLFVYDKHDDPTRQIADLRFVHCA